MVLTAPRRRSPGEARIAFEALSIEGGLLGADWLGKVAQLQAAAQEPSDYRVPKGLHIRDEIARSWRIAQACFRELETGRAAGGDARALAERFLEAFLRDALCFSSVMREEPRTIGERVYPVRFFALGDRVPIVVAPVEAGLDTPLPELGDDRRRRSAFGLLQEYLNASGAALWGVAADGLSLRIGRDNASLTRPAWIEADLARIFTEDLYPDFAALWLLAHESRFGRAEDTPEACPLEVWREAGRQEGTRARDKLSDGFRQALQILGQGFLSHAANRKLRSALHAGKLTKERYFGQLLRLVYRLVFLLTVEERDLLHQRDASDPVRRLYADGYGLRRLRDRGRPRERPRPPGRLVGSGQDRLPEPCGWRAAAWASRPRRPVRAGGMPGPRRGEAGEPRAPRGALPLGVASRVLGACSRELARHGSGRARLRLRGAFWSWSRRLPETGVRSPLRAPTRAGAMRGRRPAATTRRTSSCSSSSRAPSTP